MNIKTDRFFMTQHSPVGAWSSFTFGLPGKGASIDMETSVVKENADFYVGVSRKGNLKLMPFISGSAEVFREGGLNQEGDDSSLDVEDYWGYYPLADISRKLTGAIDEYSTKDLSLKIYTPHTALPDPEIEKISAYHCCPGILMELTIDNTGHDETAHGFIGLKSLVAGRVRAVDGCNNGNICGFAKGVKWAMIAKGNNEDVFTIKSFNVKKGVTNTEKRIHNVGNEGGICFSVPAGKQKTLQVAFGFFIDGCVTSGVSSKYYYTNHFNNVEEVCENILINSNKIKEEANKFNGILDAQVESKSKYLIISQAIRAYNSCSQLLDTDLGICFSVCEGAYMWRNTLDLAIDHLPWELWRNPWVVRNIMDWFIDRYSFEDKVEFEEEKGKLHTGGLSFTHDQGSYVAFSKPGESMYETRNMTSVHCYWHMTTEELLNGISCICAYGIKTKDYNWIEKRKDTLENLMFSLENRDHYDKEKRDGTLKAKSERSGELVNESTTYDSPQVGLMAVKGNSYITVKTLTSLVLLSEIADITGNNPLLERANSMLAKTSTALNKFILPEGYLMPNLYNNENKGKVIATLEPLSLIGWLGLTGKIIKNEKVYEVLKQHAYQCIGANGCIDSETGGMRLNSLSSYTWVSKVISCIYALEKTFAINMEKEYPTVFRELLYWIQVAEAEVTISDQVLCAERKVIGGYYYPRSASSAFWIR